MCGIFGIVTQKEQPLGQILTDAAERLTYRGYDSVGAATLSGAKIDLRKDVGRVKDVAAQYHFAEMTGQRGITQLRWATFGEPSQVNSQPHLDSDGDLVGAHNGNVVNNVELRQQFMAEGMTVRSMNDGESCVHAVERYLNRGEDFIQAIRDERRPKRRLRPLHAQGNSRAGAGGARSAEHAQRLAGCCGSD